MAERHQELTPGLKRALESWFEDYPQHIYEMAPLRRVLEEREREASIRASVSAMLQAKQEALRLLLESKFGPLSSGLVSKLEVVRDYEPEVMATSATEFVKDPYVLEFLGLKESPTLNESQLESALLNHLQEFMLELGKGLAFVGHQQRITIDGDHFYTDLVFYNRLLRCFVLIDLKMGKLTPQDLGQMQLYVNYYTREMQEEWENPAIGILLCADKNDAVVRYTLPEDQQQIFAARYYTITLEITCSRIRQNSDLWKARTLASSATDSICPARKISPLNSAASKLRCRCMPISIGKSRNKGWKEWKMYHAYASRFTFHASP
jgi:predicted nuclease of restriction endonuclease-like (RecB) superfamily